MKFPALIFMVFVLGCGNAHTQSSPDDAKVTAIRDLYKKVNAQIAEMEMAPELSSVFVIDLVVNKNNAPYPAVGIYNSTMRFYYTYGDREKNPYPDRLLRVTVTTRRSSEVESYEYLFSESGELIFSFKKDGDGERRAYFHNNKLIRMQNGDAVVVADSKDKGRAAVKIQAESKRLRTIFINSL